MRRARWLAPWKDSTVKPVFYHCIARVVERRFALGAEEKEKFRAFMRMAEKFSGCRVLSYCLMCNHIHILLEVPPAKEGVLSDKELLERLSAVYSEAFVAGVAKELADARELGMEKYAEEIHGRFSYRMNDLGEFMKALLQRFTQWFNRAHSRTGRLWEDRYKSVIVEDGVAATTMAAYIDLNPVRAGMVKDAADYRWSSYGEAMGGGSKGNGKSARAGLVRALRAHKGIAADAGFWAHDVAKEYRRLLLSGGGEKWVESVGRDGGVEVKRTRKGMGKAEADRERASLERADGISYGGMLRKRVRYFTDGVVIGSRSFVNEVFRECRDRFGQARKDGARRMRGIASPAAGELWSMRDLRKGT